MQARAIFEMDTPTIEGDAILMSLSVSLSKYCPEFSRISVVARYNAPIMRCRMATGIVNSAAIAETEIKQDPALDMCLLFSPRAVATANTVIPATIYVARNRERTIAARVHLIHDSIVKGEAERMMRPELLLARESLFGVCGPTTADDAFADTVERAIDHCYRNAYQFAPTGGTQ